MGFLKRLFGGGDEHVTPRDDRTPTDEQAIERYRYIVRTAPPQAIEQAHEQAFRQLAPELRRALLRELSKAVPAHERIDRDDPTSLARMATRAELQYPGVVERILSKSSPLMGGGYGYGGSLFGGVYMSSLAGAFVASIIAQGLYESFADIPASKGGAESATAQGEYGAQDAGLEASGYVQSGEADLGSDFGGDLGGTDF
jgi:hypothetical protein